MAGQFSRYGNGRALARNLGLNGSAEADQIGTMNATIAAGAAATTSLTTTALAKAIPSGCVIVCASITGTNVEAYTVGAAAAAAATSITVVSQTSNKARTAGDVIYVLQFAAFLALITATTAPTDNSLGSEYAATGYARQAIAWGAPTAADPPVSSNTGILTYGPFTAGTGGVLTYAALMDALTGGTNLNQYAWWTLTTAKTPAVNDSVTVAVGALTMSCL